MLWQRSRSRLVGFLALLCIAILGVYSGKPEFSNASQPARGISDPVTALQMARNVDEVDDVLGDAPSPDREAMRIKQYIDFAYIAAYSALFIALALQLRSRIALLFMTCGLIAAIFDIVENFAILRILDVPLDRTTQAMVDAIRHPSVVKWALAAIAVAGFGWMFWQAGGWMMRLIGGLEIAAAVLVGCGLLVNRVLIWAALPMFAGFVGLAVFGILGRLRPRTSPAAGGR